MKRLLTFVLIATLGMTVVNPATSAEKLVVKQSTLAGTSLVLSKLNATQIAQVKKQVATYPQATKFICTAVVYKDSKTLWQDTVAVKGRAREACNLAKSLNPSLSTYYQTKQTKAKSFAGKVLITVKYPEGATAVAGYVETEAINYKINPAYQAGKPCGINFGWQVIGLDDKGNPAYVRCTASDGTGHFEVDRNMWKIDPVTMKPIIPATVPQKTYFAYSPSTYIFPQVVTSSPQTSISPASTFNNVAPCKLDGKNDELTPNITYAIRRNPLVADLKSDFKILVLPVQFLDHKTTNKPADDMEDVVRAITDFYTRQASTDIGFEWTIPSSYRQVGKTIDSFKLKFEEGNNSYHDYTQAVIDLWDDSYDFSKYDVVIVEEPRTVTNVENPAFGPYNPKALNLLEGYYSKEGEVLHILSTGNDEQRNIPNWVHEFGHLLGLPDRNWQTDSKPGFDLMFGWYGSPELSVWLRMQLEIIKDSQIDCKTDKATSTHWVQPVAWDGDYKKGVVIRVSDHVAIVIESRRRQGYDALFGKESEGAYVYRIDTNAPVYSLTKTAWKPVDVLAPTRSKAVMDAWAFDASLDPGESVTSDDWTIKVVEAGAFGDVVQVSYTG